MNLELQPYRVKKLDAKITFCVEQELKEFWDQCIRHERLQLPEAIRAYLRDLKAKRAQAQG